MKGGKINNIGRRSRRGRNYERWGKNKELTKNQRIKQVRERGE